MWSLLLTSMITLCVLLNFICATLASSLTLTADVTRVAERGSAIFTADPIYQSALANCPNNHPPGSASIQSCRRPNKRDGANPLADPAPAPPDHPNNDVWRPWFVKCPTPRGVDYQKPGMLCGVARIWWLTPRLCEFYNLCTCDCNNDGYGGEMYALSRFNQCSRDQVLFKCQAIGGCLCVLDPYTDVGSSATSVRRAKRIVPYGAADMSELLEREETREGPFSANEKEALWAQWAREVELIDAGKNPTWYHDDPSPEGQQHAKMLNQNTP